MLVADTSSLYALFDVQDLHHDQARAEAARKRSFVVPSEILVETLALLRVRHGRAASLAMLQALRSLPHARVAAARQAVVDQAMASAGEGSLSYQDWVVVHTCRMTGAKPWTYDEDVKRAVKG